MELIVKNISKTIKKQQILTDVSATFASGKIYGIVGRNGSGKTMFFRGISGLMKVSGEVIYGDKVLGKDMRVLPNLGMIIENTQMYPEFSGYTNLKMLADINKKIGKKEIVESLERVGLDPSDKRPVAKYSLGMRQKLAIAQAIMEKPDILLLDEPTNGLDDNTVKSFWNIMREEKQRGTIVLLASHSKEDIEILADEVYHMHKGVLTKEEADEK